MSTTLPFSPADILIPNDVGLSRWAVVACDQYTSQPEYWQRVADYVGEQPSSLRLILPEAKLESPRAEAEIQTIHQTMEAYLENNWFRLLENGFLYIERQLNSGKIRRGLLGKVDLEQYDYTRGAQTPVRATEGTVLSRIAPRTAVRRGAAIELPHIMLLIDDPEGTVVEALTAEKSRMPTEYMASLMENGGRVSGWSLREEHKSAVLSALAALGDARRFEDFYHAPGQAPLVFAIGDGNHSLAAAKSCWEERKGNLSPEERENHPARFALAELVNLHDESLAFEAIHRLLLNVEPRAVLDALTAFYPGTTLREGAPGGKSETPAHTFTAVFGGKTVQITVPKPEAQLEVATLQNFLDEYLAAQGGKIDYIHGEAVLRDLTRQENTLGFLLPPMEKRQLFPTVLFDGALPRKTFSMGEAEDKRFYLEARRIR